jgi:starvation-inducible DNA-binding protein
MDELKTALTKVLANTFVMYFKAHAYHWNVEGMFFPQFHEFFGNLYEELHGAVDPIAEHIRAIDGYAPASLSDIKSASVIAESMLITEPKQMISNLISDNNLVIISLMQAYQEAEKVSEIGLANFLQDRIDIHQKHGWMLKASAK